MNIITISGPDGGPAFPTLMKADNLAIAEGGMSLRDHFAGLAMQGYLASVAEDFEPAEHASKIAEDSYALADAMLRARQKGGAS